MFVLLCKYSNKSRVAEKSDEVFPASAGCLPIFEETL